MRIQSANGTYLSFRYPNSSRKPGYRDYQIYRRARSESIATRKVNGRYVLPTTYSYEWLNQVLVPWETALYGRNSYYYGNGFFHVPIDSSSTKYAPPSEPRSNLINKAISNVRTQKVAGGVFLGEAKSSLKMITSRARQIFRIFNHAKRLNVLGVMRELNISSRPKRVFRDANNLLLEYRFGWLPLFQEIYAACQALQETDQLSRNSIVTTSARHTATAKSTVKHINDALNYMIYEATREQKVYLTYELTRPQGSLRELYGIDDPIKTAYELLPLSFVLDWFLPIGDFLTALNVNNVRFLHGCSTNMVEVKATPTGGNRVYKYTGDAKASTYVSFSRVVILDASVSLPRLRVPFSLPKAATAVQLILQRL